MHINKKSYFKLLFFSYSLCSLITIHILAIHVLLNTISLSAALDTVYVADNDDDYDRFTEKERSLCPRWNNIRFFYHDNLIKHDRDFALTSTNLFCAIHHDETKLILKCLDSGAGDNKAYQIMIPIGVLPSTPLQHAAIFANKSASIQALANAGCDFKVLDCNGYNLLHLLCGANRFWGTIKNCYQKNNFDEIIKTFIICGAPTLQCDYNGNSPLDTLAKTYNSLFESQWPFKPKLNKQYDLERVIKNCSIAFNILTYVNDHTPKEIEKALHYIRPLPMSFLKPYIKEYTCDKLAFKIFSKKIIQSTGNLLPTNMQTHIASFLVSPYKSELEIFQAQNQALRKEYSTHKKFCPIPQPMWFEKKKEKKLDQPEQKENSSTTCCIQ